MPRLIPPELGNGKRPSDPAFARATAPGTPGPNSDTAVPVLDVSEDTHELVGREHDAALDPKDDSVWPFAAIVLVDNARPVDGSRPGPVPINVGGSTLHEAATECVTCVAALCADMPEWVACTDENLGAVLAEHFTVKGYASCKVIPMEEAS